MARVLFVAKDEEMADIFSRHLCLDDHEIRIARTLEAITIAANFQPNVLITDQPLQDAPTGLPVAQRLCKSLPDLKIIFWSSRGVVGDLNAGELSCDVARDTPAAVLRTAANRLASG